MVEIREAKVKYTLREYITFPLVYLVIFLIYFGELIAGDYDDYIKGWFTSKIVSREEE